MGRWSDCGIGRLSCGSRRGGSWMELADPHADRADIEHNRKDAKEEAAHRLVWNETDAVDAAGEVPLARAECDPIEGDRKARHHQRRQPASPSPVLRRQADQNSGKDEHQPRRNGHQTIRGQRICAYRAIERQSRDHQTRRGREQLDREVSTLTIPGNRRGACLVRLSTFASSKSATDAIAASVNRMRSVRIRSEVNGPSADAKTTRPGWCGSWRISIWLPLRCCPAHA